jgi:hypothetical protein
LGGMKFQPCTSTGSTTSHISSGKPATIMHIP